MTKQEILKKLISHYENCIKEIEGMNKPEFSSNIRKYLQSKDIHHGVCHCASERYLTSIYGKNWQVRNISTIDHYWCKSPSLLLDGSKVQKSDIIEVLQKRVDIMKKEYTMPE